MSTFTRPGAKVPPFGSSLLGFDELGGTDASIAIQVTQTTDKDASYNDVDESYTYKDEDARTINKVAMEIMDGKMKGFSVDVKDVAAMSAIGTLCSRFASVMQDEIQYRYLLTNRGGNAQKLVNIIQMLLDYPSLDQTLKSGLLKALLRISTRASVFPTCLTLHGVEFDTEPISETCLSKIWQGTFKKHSVALKVIKIYRDKHITNLLKSLWKEGILWAHLSHPNVIPFYGIYHLHNLEEQFCLVSPWMKQGNIMDFLSRSPSANRVGLVYEIAQGLQYLHDNDVVHGDLKATNVLITDSGQACLCDFGLSTISIDSDIMAYTSVETIPQYGGTLRYQAPELFMIQEGDKMTKECDIYSFACLCYEVFTNKIPFYEIRTEPAVIFQVANGSRPTRPPPSNPSWNYWGLSLSIWQLIEDCWNHTPALRPRAPEITLTLEAHLNKNYPRHNAEQESFSSAAFRRPLYDIVFMSTSGFKEPSKDDYLELADVKYPTPLLYSRGIKIWRARSILTMRTGSSGMYTDPSIYSYETGGTARQESNFSHKTPSIISSTLSTLSEDTFYAGKTQTDPYKVLLLGAAQTGKTTIINQLKIAYGDGFSASDREMWLEMVFENFLEAVKAVINYMAERSIECSTLAGKRCFQDLYNIKYYDIVGGTNRYIASLETFLRDPNVIRIMARDWARYRLNTSQKYFLYQASRFGKSDYLPSDMDILLVDRRTNGIWETDLKMRNLHIRIYDVGGARSERRKWINRFGSITSVIFCAALDDYYKVLSDDNITNRMEDSILLFEAVHSSRWFTGKPTILILNKFDAFKEILPMIPLKDPDYQGGGDVGKAVMFILQKYKAKVASVPKPVYAHLLQATDLRNVRQVFRTVRDEILMTALEGHVNNLRLMD